MAKVAHAWFSVVTG